MSLPVEQIIQPEEQDLIQKEAKVKAIPKIMIVDDDVELLEELKELLTFNCYEVDAIPNSSLAFEKARKERPDLILMDLKMKPKSGFQLADELQNSFQTKMIPIIAVTGFFTEKEHVLMMKMCGMKHVILKPFDPTELLAKITAILEKVKVEDPDLEAEF